MFIRSLIMIECPLDAKHYSRHWDRDNKSVQSFKCIFKSVESIQHLICAYVIYKALNKALL